MSPDPITKIAVLVSGRGTNLQSIIDAVQSGRVSAEIALVFSNREDAPGLERARRAGLETLFLSHRAFPTREAFDERLVQELQARGVTLVCLAGFMRIFSAPMLANFHCSRTQSTSSTSSVWPYKSPS